MIITVKWNPVKAAPAVTMSQSSAFNDIKKALIDIVYIYSDSVNLGNQQQSFWNKDNNIKSLEDSLIQRTRDDKLLNNAINKYGSDSFGLGCDFAGVAIALSVPVTGPIAAAALLGGGVLLVLDGAMWSLEIFDNESESTKLKNKTAYIRLAAMVATLPDAIRTVSKGLAGDYKSLLNFLQKEKIPVTKSSVNILINTIEKNERKIEKLKLLLQQNIIKLLSRDTTSVGLTAYSTVTMTKDELRPDNNDPVAKILRHIHDFSFDIISGTKRK